MLKTIKQTIQGLRQVKPLIIGFGEKELPD